LGTINWFQLLFRECKNAFPAEWLSAAFSVYLNDNAFVEAFSTKRKMDIFPSFDFLKKEFFFNV
jgi:hypothetical protein